MHSNVSSPRANRACDTGPGAPRTRRQLQSHPGPWAITSSAVLHCAGQSRRRQPLSFLIVPRRVPVATSTVEVRVAPPGASAVASGSFSPGFYQDLLTHKLGRRSEQGPRGEMVLPLRAHSISTSSSLRGRPACQAQRALEVMVVLASCWCVCEGSDDGIGASLVPAGSTARNSVCRRWRQSGPGLSTLHNLAKLEGKLRGDRGRSRGQRVPNSCRKKSRHHSREYGVRP